MSRKNKLPRSTLGFIWNMFIVVLVIVMMGSMIIFCAYIVIENEDGLSKSPGIRGKEESKRNYISRDLPQGDDGIKFYYPVDKHRISSFFGPRKRPTKGASTNHKGIDISVNRQYTEIYPSRPGEVVLVSKCSTKPSSLNGGAKCTSGYGNYVIIKHELRNSVVRYTLYAHMYEIKVRKGQFVDMGDIVGIVGNTGTSSGMHLHFEIRTELNGGQIDPIPLLYCGGKEMSGSNLKKTPERLVGECFLYRRE